MDGIDPLAEGVVSKDITSKDMVSKDMVDEEKRVDRIGTAALATLLTIFQQHHHHGQKRRRRAAATASGAHEDVSESGESSQDRSGSAGEIDEEEEEEDEEEEEWTEEADAVDGYSRPSGVSAPAHRRTPLGKRPRSPSPQATPDTGPNGAANHRRFANGVKRLRHMESGSPSQLPAAGDTHPDPRSTWIKILNQTALRATGREMDQATEDMVRQMDIRTRNDVIHATLDFRARFAGQVSEEDSAAVFAFLQANPAVTKRYSFEDPETKARTFSGWVEHLTGKKIRFESRGEVLSTTLTAQVHSQNARQRQPAVTVGAPVAEKRVLLRPQVLQQVDKESQGPLKDRVRLWLDNVLP